MVELNDTLSDIYEINLSIDVPEYETNDINTFYIYRCPLVKSASFAVMHLAMPIVEFLNLEDELRQNRHSNVEVELFIADRTDSDKDRFRGHKKLKKIIKKRYIVLYAFSTEPLNSNNETPMVSLYLVNPILFFLNNNNSYNDILENTTALETVEKFEAFLVETYGAKTFTFLKTGKTDFLNTFKYEQILVRTINDLQVPTFLLQTYKVFNTYSYYFFDDFTISDKALTDITCYLINFGNKNVFEKLDILSESYSDYQFSISLKNVQPLYDLYDSLEKQNPTFILEGKDFNFKNNKTTGTANVPQLNATAENDNIQENRKIKVTETTITKVAKPPTEFLNLYAPDDVNNAKTRFENISKQLRKEFQAIYTFEVLNAHPDAIQFNRIYNLDQLDITSYSFTPLSIVNIFRRESQQTFLKHTVQFQCLKYISDGK